jgi:hypothetical protein
MCRNFTYEVVGQRRKLKTMLRFLHFWLLLNHQYREIADRIL